MNRRDDLAERDRRLLEEIEEIIANGGRERRGEDSLYGLCAHLADTVPQADDAFRQRLGSRLLAKLQQYEVGAVGATPSGEEVSAGIRSWFMQLAPWGGCVRRLSKGCMTMRRRFVFAIVIASLTTISTVALVPPVRAQVAAWLGFGLRKQDRLPPLVVKVLDRAPWDTEGDASFEMLTFEIREGRWSQLEGATFAIPQPGALIPLFEGKTLPVPRYLPEGYHWQGVANSGDARAWMALSFAPVAGQSSAGGGSPLPPYDHDIVNYLVGGNEEDDLLLLAQFRGNLEPALLFQAYHVMSPERHAPAAVSGVPMDSLPGVVPTPTPSASFYAARTQVGVVVQPAEDQEGLVFLVGRGELHETAIRGSVAWWYQGAWNAAGDWAEDAAVNLIWEEAGSTYQLIGQGLPLTELVSIAESLPPAAQ